LFHGHSILQPAGHGQSKKGLILRAVSFPRLEPIEWFSLPFGSSSSVGRETALLFSIAATSSAQKKRNTRTRWNVDGWKRGFFLTTVLSGLFSLDSLLPWPERLLSIRKMKREKNSYKIENMTAARYSSFLSCGCQIIFYLIILFSPETFSFQDSPAGLFPSFLCLAAGCCP